MRICELPSTTMGRLLSAWGNIGTSTTRVEGRVHDGAAAGERVGGRAGGGGDDQAVGPLPVDETVVDGQIEFDHLGRGAGVHHHIVESVGMVTTLPPRYTRASSRALLALVLAVEYRRHLAAHLVGHDIREFPGDRD